MLAASRTRKLVQRLESRQTKQPSGPPVLLQSHGNKGATQHTATTSTLRTTTQQTDTHRPGPLCRASLCGHLLAPWPAVCVQAENLPMVGSPSSRPQHTKRGSYTSGGSARSARVPLQAAQTVCISLRLSQPPFFTLGLGSFETALGRSLPCNCLH